MGQKVNPVGLRLGINRTWDSRWYAGKAEYGQIKLVAHQEGTDVVLTLSDDGGGIRLDKIRTRAESMGWIKPGESAERGLDCRKPKPLANSGGMRLRRLTSLIRPIN